MESVYINVECAADLIGKSQQRIREQIRSGMLQASLTSAQSGGGKNGLTYRISLESLPAEAQLKYYQQIAKDTDIPNNADLTSYKEKYGETGLQELLKARNIVLTMRGMRETAIGTFQAEMAKYAEQIGVNLRTLYRWEKAYSEQGLNGLMRKGRSDKGASRTMCYEARRYIWEQYLGPQRRTQEAILYNLQKYAKEKGDCVCEECPFRAGSENRDAMIGTEDIEYYPECDQAGNGIIPPPNRYAVNRVIDQLTEEEECYMRKGRKAWEAAFMFKNKRRKPELTNECWFGDHHQFDVFVLDESGKPVRPWLTAWYDIATGEVVGKCLSLCPNSQTISEALVRAIAVKRDSPVCGVPKFIYTDNGRDYRCERFEGGAFGEMGLGDLNAGISTQPIYQVLMIQVVHAKEYHGWAKPVERWFRTLEERYCRELPGYCGGSPEARPENFQHTLDALVKRGELLTLGELYDILSDEILPAYHNTPHSEYNGETPAERYARLPKARMDQPSWAVLSLVKDEYETRKVNTQGIRFRNRLYWDMGIAHMAGQDVMIRYNRDCLDTLTVCTIAKEGEPSRFICEAEPKEYLKMVGEDEEKLARYNAIPKIQERQLRKSLQAKGIKLPGKRSSGHVYYDDIDMDFAQGNITSLEAEQISKGRKEANERREHTRDTPERSGPNKVVDMLRRGYDQLLKEG